MDGQDAETETFKKTKNNLVFRPVISLKIVSIGTAVCAAFVRVDYSIFLGRLYSLTGLSNTVLNEFKSYLNRFFGKCG